MNSVNSVNSDSESYYVKSIVNYSISLPIFAQALGKLHGVRGDIIYWEPVIGPWLLHFASVYESITDKISADLLNKTSSEHKYLLAGSHENCYGWSEFMATFANYKFRDSLILQYCSVRSGKKIAGIDVTKHVEEPQVRKFGSILQGLTLITKRSEVILEGVFTLILFALSKAIYRQNAILVDSRQLDFSLKVSIFKKSLGRIAPTPTINLRDAMNYFKKKPSCNLAFRARLRSLINFPSDEGSKIFIEVAVLNFPIAHLEDYERIRKQASRLFSMRPSVLYLSISHYFDEVLKCAIGEWSSQGIRVVVGQHGAGYGLYKFSTYEYFDLRSADVFLTWGWSSSKKKTRIMPSIRLSSFVKQKSRCRKGRGYVLYVCSPLPNFYGETFNFSPEDSFLKDCAQANFIKNCPAHLKANVRIRPYPVNSTAFGSYDVSAFVEAGFEIQEGDSNYSAYSCAKLLIFELPSTGFFESLVIDTPCVLYMPGIGNIPWSDLGKDFVKLITAANILITSELELVALLERDVDDWFNKKENTDFRAKLVRNFALNSEKYIDNIIAELFRISSVDLNEQREESVVKSFNNE
jgi:putative transferase (TIGR04331 family)